MQLLPLATNYLKSAVVSPDACAEALLDALPPVMRMVRKHMRDERATGLSLPQFRTMCFLRSTPSAKLLAVAEFLGASMPTTSRIVSGLVSRGFVQRCEGSGDRRCIKLGLTSKGKLATEKARKVTQAELAKELTLLSAEERATIMLGMNSLRTLFSPSGVSSATVSAPNI